MLQFVVWGVGYRGKMLLKCIGHTRIAAFIDNDEKLQGTYFNDIPIISFQAYLNKFNDHLIIISPSVSPSVIDGIFQKIRRAGNLQYLLLERCPMELPYYEGELPYQEMLSTVNISKRDNCILLAGINLFTILLYEYMREDGYQVFLYDSHGEEGIIQEIKKDRYYTFISDNELTSICKILITDRFLDRTNAFKFSNSTQFYRFPYLKRYDYSRVQKFHNIHNNSRCFIVATGPSLQIDDLDKLHSQKEVTISVNTVYNCFHLTKWRPNYLVITDTAALSIYFDEIQNADVDYKFLADRQYKLWYEINRTDIILFHYFTEYYEEEGPDFSASMDVGAYYGGSVLYSAIQLAVYMGFKEIYIIGADCEYKGNGRTEEDHFIPNYFTRDGAPGGLISEKIFAAYRVARKYADSHGIKICNATRGGKLEVFERVEFDSIFKTDE